MAAFQKLSLPKMTEPKNISQAEDASLLLKSADCK
jgi:hypothetical protein